MANLFPKNENILFSHSLEAKRPADRGDRRQGEQETVDDEEVFLVSGKGKCFDVA
jgi:hypothetical protein